MLTARQAALRTVLIAEQHVIEQEARIDRQRDLILALAKGGHERMLREARELLTQMEALLAEMDDSLARADERLERLGDTAEQGPVIGPIPAVCDSPFSALRHKLW